MEELLEKIDKLDLLSDEQLENASFEELSLYLQELNILDKLVDSCSNEVNDKVGDNNG